MRQTILMLSLAFFACRSFAQKPVIDTGTFGKWPKIEKNTPHLSNDGKYAMYVENDPAPKQHILHIISFDRKRKFSCAGVKAESGTLGFSNDSRQALYLTDKDTLYFLELKTFKKHFVLNVRNFTIASDGDWVAWQSNDKLAKLTIVNTFSGKQLSFPVTKQYAFSNNGDVLCFASALKSNGQVDLSSITWVDLRTGKFSEVWRGTGLDIFVFDNSGTRITFRAQSVDNVTALYRYNVGEYVAKIVAGDTQHPIPNGFILNNDPLRFSKEGDKILFGLQKIAHSVKGYNNVTVHNASDDHDGDDPAATNYYAIAVPDAGKVYCLNPNGQKLVSNPWHFEHQLLFELDVNKKFWHQTGEEKFELANLDNGLKKTLSITSTIRLFYHPTSMSFTPDEKYLVWFNTDSGSFFSYETTNGHIRNISREIKVPLAPDLPCRPVHSTFPFGIAAYSSGGHSLYLYDQYDVWKVDVSAKEKPVNITNGYGQAHQIIFGITNPNPDQFNEPFIIKMPPIVLNGFDPENKQNGFFILNKFGENPSKACLDNCCYYIERKDAGYVWHTHSMQPIKAKNAGVYLLTRQTTTEYPNLYLTHDLGHFMAISDFHPEKSYNWMTSELIDWKNKAGEQQKGILYKPENFDSNKKYPVIFTYYEQRSDELHAYVAPDWLYCQLNISYWVSNGYLVFVPDMNFHYQHQGQGAVESVVSGVNYLSKLPYIDVGRIGLQGGSYSGFETDYIVTHTHNIFAAASANASCGVDHFSWELLPNYSGELGQIGLGLGALPWTDPQLYMDASPVFGVAETTTPLLLEDGNRDGDLGISQFYEQTCEMYHALRRADKKCWFLDYYNSGHGTDGEDAKDFTMRMRQFFDYYLKDAPPPVWMTSTSQDNQPISTSLELETSGKRP